MDDRCSILVVEEQQQRRRILVSLIEREIKPQKCIEADSIDAVTKVIEQHPVSFAIVEASPCSKKSLALAEEIKLKCPMLPVLAVSIEPDELNYVEKSRNQISENEINRIISGIRYIESLTKSGISGFTVAVNI